MPRVLLVSRKLPFVLVRGGDKDQDDWRADPPAEECSSHFDQAAMNIKEVKALRDCIWVGWPGACPVEPLEQSELKEAILEVRQRRHIPMVQGGVWDSSRSMVTPLLLCVCLIHVPREEHGYQPTFNF
jgi:hypothetical protein